MIRHTVFGITSAVVIIAFYRSSTEFTDMGKLSISSAYLGLVTLVIALAIGPLNILLGKPNPVSSYLRRDFGIWSAILALFHTIVGLQVHFGGKFWFYFMYLPDHPHLIPLRHDPFGITNYLGLASALLMLILMLISNNKSIRKLTAKRWKSWQRSAYLVAIMVPLHAVIYQFLENRIPGFCILLATLILAMLVMQYTGFIRFKKLKQKKLAGVNPLING